jgi:hypothetical protein
MSGALSNAYGKRHAQTTYQVAPRLSFGQRVFSLALFAGCRRAGGVPYLVSSWASRDS